jgi:hypothetical protein
MREQRYSPTHSKSRHYMEMHCTNRQPAIHTGQTMWVSQPAYRGTKCTVPTVSQPYTLDRLRESHSQHTEEQNALYQPSASHTHWTDYVSLTASIQRNKMHCTNRQPAIHTGRTVWVSQPAYRGTKFLSLPVISVVVRFSTLGTGNNNGQPYRNYKV